MTDKEIKAVEIIKKEIETLKNELEIENSDLECERDEPRIAYLLQQIDTRETVLNYMNKKEIIDFIEQNTLYNKSPIQDCIEMANKLSIIECKVKSLTGLSLETIIDLFAKGYVLTLPKDRQENIDFNQVGYAIGSIYKDIQNGVEKAFNENKEGSNV